MNTSIYLRSTVTFIVNPIERRNLMLPEFIVTEYRDGITARQVICYDAFEVGMLINDAMGTAEKVGLLEPEPALSLPEALPIPPADEQVLKAPGSAPIQPLDEEGRVALPPLEDGIPF